MKKIALAAIIFAALHAAPAHADSVYCVNCSTSAMQALEKALATSQLAELKLAYDQYVQQTAQQIQMVQQNIEQYANMVQNTVQLPAHLIREVSGELSKLGRLTGALHTMRNDITGMANVFDELYRTRDEFRELASLPRDMLSGGAVTYRTYWDNWSDRVDESSKRPSWRATSLPLCKYRSPASSANSLRPSSRRIWRDSPRRKRWIRWRRTYIAKCLMGLTSWIPHPSLIHFNWGYFSLVLRINLYCL